MGYSQHAGVVIVCDGTPAAARRIERVLSNDPATGVMRHADAGYEIAHRLRAPAGLGAALSGRATGSASTMTSAAKLWRNARLATCDDSMRVIARGALITTRRTHRLGGAGSGNPGCRHDRRCDPERALAREPG